MKLKLLIFSSILWLALGSCRQGVKLPSEIKMTMVEPGHPSFAGVAPRGWYQNDLTPRFKSKLEKFLKRNRVKIEKRDFINTAYRLEINNIRDIKKTTTESHSSGFNCPTFNIDVSNVTVSIDITLWKDQTPLERWTFAETCYQKVNSRKINKEEDDSCLEYCASNLPYYNLKKMIKRCAKQARVVISQKIYDTAF